EGEAPPGRRIRPVAPPWPCGRARRGGPREPREGDQLAASAQPRTRPRDSAAAPRQRPRRPAGRGRPRPDRPRRLLLRRKWVIGFICKGKGSCFRSMTYHLPPTPHPLTLVRVWRLCRKKYVAFDGEGSRIAGGRWNRRGTAMVYTSATLSL